MNFEALALSVGLALAAVPVIVLVHRWWAGFTAKRLVDQVMQATPLAGSTERSKLIPESLFVVGVSDARISCSRPDQKVESVTWDDLQCVEVVNTDEGPFLPDVFWILHGSHDRCVIPQGATGEKQLLERIQQLPGFDNQALINAMGVTTNKRSLCWRRPKANI